MVGLTHNMMIFEAKRDLRKEIDGLELLINSMSNESKQLYEILVPIYIKGYGSLQISHHREFDKFVVDMVGGITIMRSAEGVWVSGKNETIRERMVPVRIICTREQMYEIARFALKHYEQEEILYYQLTTVSPTFVKEEDALQTV